MGRIVHRKLFKRQKIYQQNSKFHLLYGLVQLFRLFVVFERFTRAYKNQIALEIVLLPIQKCQLISLLIFTGQHTKWGGQERSASGWRLALRGGNITEKKIGEKGASQKEQQRRGCIRTKIKENYTQITKTGYSQTKNTF